MFQDELGSAQISSPDRAELRPQNSFTLPYSGSLQALEEQEGGQQLHNLFMFNLVSPYYSIFSFSVLIKR